MSTGNFKFIMLKQKSSVEINDHFDFKKGDTETIDESLAVE